MKRNTELIPTLPFAELEGMDSNQISADGITAEVSRLARNEFVSIEKNIAGLGFFTPTTKRSKDTPPKVIKFTHSIGGKKVEAKVTIAANVLHGMPNTADQDKYLAFQKILERIKRERGRIENPITFTSSELLNLLGKSDGGANFKEIESWCEVMVSTLIKSEGAVWSAGKQQFASDTFVVFQRFKRAGQTLDDGTTADKNYVWLSDWYLENINDHYLLPIDFDTYRKLRSNIAKGLIPLLQIWLYASREQGFFEKRYSELAQLLNIAQYSFESKIKEKLAPGLDELVDQRYLADWKLMKTRDRTGYKIVFYHGEKFYEDRTKRVTKAQRLLQPESAVPAESRSPDSLLSRLGSEFGVSESAARKIVTKYPPEKIVRQLDAFRFRSSEISNVPGFIVSAIENDYSLPPAYFDFLGQQEQERLEMIERKAREGCGFCQGHGYRIIKDDQEEFGSEHKCTHDQAVESKLEDYDFSLIPDYFGANI